MEFAVGLSVTEVGWMKPSFVQTCSLGGTGDGLEERSSGGLCPTEVNAFIEAEFTEVSD